MLAWGNQTYRAADLDRVYVSATNFVKRFLTLVQKKITFPACAKENKMPPDLKRLILDAGGYSKVAGKMPKKNGEKEVTKQTIWSWVNVLHRVPATRVMDLEEAIGVPRHIIRPDLYPLEREKR